MMKYPILIIAYLVLTPNHIFPQVTEPTVVDTTLANEYFLKAETLNKGARYDSSTFYLEKAKEIYEKAQDWRRYLKCWNKIGRNYIWSGDSKGMAILRQALEFGKGIGRNDLVLAETYNYLGQGYAGEKRIDQSVEHLQKSIEIQIAILGENSISVANSYHEFGITYAEAGDYDKAIEYYQKALDIKVAAVGRTHESVATTINNIGIAYGWKGEHEKALKYFLEATQIKSQIFGGELSRNLLSSYGNIGITYSEMGDLDQALEYYNKILSLAHSKLEQNDWIIGHTYQNIGTIYRRKKDYDLALDFYEKALERDYNYTRFGVAAIYQDIGEIYSLKYDYETALANYQKAIIILADDFDHTTIYSNPSVEMINPVESNINAFVSKATIADATRV